MKRIKINNRPGSWFDLDVAEKFREDSYFNGNNFISKSTGSQWEHEILFITKSGRYILNSWSQWQGSIETYNEISKEEASLWFIKNEYSDEEIPDEFKEFISECEV